MICVAFYLPSLDAGGIERVVLNLLTHLDRGRFRAVLILGRGGGLLLPHVPGDVEVRTLEGRRASFVAPALARQLRDTGAHVVYSGTNAANLATILAACLAGNRLAVIPSEHTPPSVFLKEAKWRTARVAAMRLLYPRATTVAVPLADVGQELKHILRLPKLSISVLPNPVIAETLYELRGQEPGISLPEGADPLLVCSGRLVSAKGFDILLKALALLQSSRCPPNLVVLGDGPERKNLEALAVSLGIAGRVRFAGMVDNPFAVFRRATAFVQSSRREGFGNVLIEAMACGAPVVAADCPFGPRIILRDGAVGLLVPPEDPDALAGGIERLLEDDKLAARFKTAGAERAREFEVARTVPRFEALFEELVLARDGRSSAPPTQSRS